ncbi:NADH-quinone oxidoreductase subunit C [Streptomyces sp. NPDC092296]|uniref:NADH-quinone oxidoreductase subunit C n=1 Tax=Streptomyces sp. NPDC092296 TaxID=3366012 RepID=UPI003814EB33
MTFDRTPEEAAAAIGDWATAELSYQLLTVDVPAEHWIDSLTAARDNLGLAYFDWLSAVDELAEGFSVAAHLAAVGDAAPARHLLLRTRVPRDGAALPTATGVYAGAGWHERETHEMFGIDFPGHPGLSTLLLPDGFEGHPLRKEFVLAARVAKAWPGAKEPGESDHGEGQAAGRRRMLPPGVPDPNEWGPLKGTLPPVAERPARGARTAAGAGERPVRADRPRRTRSVSGGSASQTTPTPGEATPSTPPTRDRTPDAPWQVSPPPTPAEAMPETPTQPEATPARPETPAEPTPETPAQPEATPAEAMPETPTQPEATPARPETPAEPTPETPAEPAAPEDNPSPRPDGDGA